jgi:hypothetical protein
LRRLIELAQNVLWGHNLLEITVQYIAAGRELRRRAPPRVVRNPPQVHPYPPQPRPQYPPASRGFSLPTILRPYPSQSPNQPNQPSQTSQPNPPTHPTYDQQVPSCPYSQSCPQARYPPYQDAVPLIAPVRPPSVTARNAGQIQSRVDAATMPPPRRSTLPMTTAIARTPPALTTAHRQQPAGWAASCQLAPAQQAPLRLSTRAPEGENDSATPVQPPTMEQDREFRQLIDTYRELNPGNLDQDPLLDIFVNSPPAQPQNPQ